MLWILICTVHLTVGSYHVTYAFVKECQGTPSSKQAGNLKFKWLQQDSNPQNIQATIECGFTMKRVRNMIRTYSQMLRTDKYSQHSSIIWPVWLNGWVFNYELSGCGFESRCSHLGLCFLKTLQTFYFSKVFYIVRLLRSVTSLKYFTSFNSSNILLKHLIIKPFGLFNTIPLSGTKPLVNNLLMSKF